MAAAPELADAMVTAKTISGLRNVRDLKDNSPLWYHRVRLQDEVVQIELTFTKQEGDLVSS